jgi:hypothetical protein
MCVELDPSHLSVEHNIEDILKKDSVNSCT